MLKQPSQRSSTARFMFPPLQIHGADGRGTPFHDLLTIDVPLSVLIDRYGMESKEHAVQMNTLFK
jgi:hypothetical protein